LQRYGSVGILWYMSDDVAQLSSRGTVTLPAALRRELGLSEGDVLTVRIANGAIVLTPAILTEVEAYTDERIREFEGAARMSEGELLAARRAWRVTRRTT
jgi:AbrB family looped-hinge helix DNA binding protein